MSKKKDINYGLIVLLLILIGAVIFFIYYQKELNSRKSSDNNHQNNDGISDATINQLYDNAFLTYEEESVMNAKDLESLETKLDISDFSNSLKLSYGLKDQDEKNIGKDERYVKKPITDKEGYTYSGRYIRSTFVGNQLERIFGPIQYKNQTIKLPNIKYVYNAGMDAYQIYEKKVTNPVKVTYIESSFDDKHIYIKEYAAYTITESDGFKTSYTRHQALLPIGITSENIMENLDLVDKYLYTFDYNENVDKYFLSSIIYQK